MHDDEPHATQSPTSAREVADLYRYEQMHWRLRQETRENTRHIAASAPILGDQPSLPAGLRDIQPPDVAVAPAMTG